MNRTKDTFQFSSAGIIARWQPVHLGHAAVLHALCRQAETVKIGIGSANEQNARSPFALKEVLDMLHLILTGYDNYDLIPLPDLHDGPRWREMVWDKLGPLDVFFTANPYVKSLLAEDYTIRHPVEIIAPEDQVPVTGTQVRLAIARGEPYQHLIPLKITDYLEQNNLIDRFRQQYGLATLAMANTIIE